jgi:hypothetical protein
MLINFYDQVPRVYPNSSRDFQYLSWLINIVLNSVKHNVDDMYDLPSVGADPRLTELLALTLGFKVSRNYDQEQLAALVSVLPSLMKYKGTEKAVRLAGETLLKASGALGSFDCVEKNNVLEVTIPKDLIDVTLFTDLLPYILPAGMTCRIIRKTQVQYKNTTEVIYGQTLKASWQPDISANNQGGITGLAEMFGVGEPKFAFHKGQKEDPTSSESSEANTGLLDTNIIPIVDSPIYSDAGRKEDKSK